MALEYEGPIGEITGEQALLWLNDHQGQELTVTIARPGAALLGVRGVLRRPGPQESTTDSVGYFIGDGGELTLPLPFVPTTCEVVLDEDWVSLEAVMEDGTRVEATLGEV